MSGMVESPFRMSTSGREAFPDVREWSGCHVGCPGRPVDHSRTSERDSQHLPDIREDLPDVRQLSGGPPNFREWLKDFPRCPVVVGWLFQMFGSGLESLPNVRGALPDVREWSVGPPGCPGVVGWPSRMSGRCRESLPDVWEWWEAFSDVREWLGDPPEYP